MAQFNSPKPATVLVVEGNRLVQHELADWLTELELTVLTANDADGAILLLDAHPEITLLLTGVQMSGTMDGVRLAHHVAERWPPVKIIVMSGRLESNLAGLPTNSVFISKPYQPEHLWRVIQGAVASALH